MTITFGALETMTEAEVLRELAGYYRDASKRRRVYYPNGFLDHDIVMAAVLERAAETAPQTLAVNIEPVRLGHCFCRQEWWCCHCGGKMYEVESPSCPARTAKWDDPPGNATPGAPQT